MEVIDALSTLDTQELAIMLGHVVISGAEREFNLISKSEVGLSHETSDTK